MKVKIETGMLSLSVTSALADQSPKRVIVRITRPQLNRLVFRITSLVCVLALWDPKRRGPSTRFDCLREKSALSRFFVFLGTRLHLRPNSEQVQQKIRKIKKIKGRKLRRD